MHIIKFNLSGTFAFFKNPMVNSNMFFTFNNIHKVAIMGIFGSILGLNGYSKQKLDSILFNKEVQYPEFYNILKDIEISVVPIEGVHFDKKVQIFNDSTMFGNKDKGSFGSMLNVREEWLENPKWDIYVKINENSKHEMELSERLINNKFVFIPYLGKNDHFANITNVEKIEDFSTIDAVNVNIDSFYKFDDFEILENGDYDFFDTDSYLKSVYKEILPVALDANNFYIFEKIAHTENMLSAKSSDTKICSVNNLNLAFI